MIDLALMERLVAALAPEARLVLIGDPDQLPSVEAGQVLTDLLSAATASVGAEGGEGAPPAARGIERNELARSAADRRVVRVQREDDRTGGTDA